jgi:prepilin-type N-terminal cleavage/methylation domain-containing protein
MKNSTLDNPSRNTRSTRRVLFNSCCRSAAARPIGFTLIELLVVISIIGILAGLTFGVSRGIKISAAKSRAKTELAQVQSAIEGYKSKLGYYPPDNPNQLWNRNTLYYELTGTKALNATSFQAANGTTISSAVIATLAPGLMNVTQLNTGSDDSSTAIPFFRELNASQYLAVNNPITATVLGTTIPGPFANMFTATSSKKINPWSYQRSGTLHNAGSFDLWIDINFGSTTFRVSNWSTTPTQLP